MRGHMKRYQYTLTDLEVIICIIVERTLLDITILFCARELYL